MNKSELRNHIKEVLNRSDLSDTLANTFIDHTLSRVQRILRIPSMERTATQTVSGGYDGFVIPNSFLELISIRSQGNQACTKIEYTDFIALANVTGTPTKFTREPATNRLLLHPIPSSGTVLELKYYGELTALDTDTSTNEISDIAEDLIVYGALSYAADYFIDERKQLFESSFQNYLTELQSQKVDEAFGGANLSISGAYQYTDYQPNE
tara:strand:- start:4430 stop:5059 length:630 start_codon:yes stop_codon:yes gene_type:complete